MSYGKMNGFAVIKSVYKDKDDEGFAEPRDGNESNAKIATVIEYGKQGQPPKPFLKQTKKRSKKPAQEAMIKKFEEETKKL